MGTETSQGPFGLSPEWLNFGALGLLAIGVIVAATVVMSGGRNQTLAVLFMGFTLIVAALAIGSELYKGGTALEDVKSKLDQANKDRDAAVTARDAAVAEKDEAIARSTELSSKMETTVANVNGQLVAIVNALDAKWCNEISDLPNDSEVRRGAGNFINQMRTSVRSIRHTLGVLDDSEVPSDCEHLAASP